jgi:hypothetical protein
MWMMTSEGRSVFFPSGAPTTWATEEKIHSFRDLEDGWHYGEGVHFQQSTLDSAIFLNQQAIKLALFETDAFPGVNGEVMVAIYLDEHYLEFILEPDGTVTFCREREDEEVLYRDGLSLQEAKTIILDFSGEIWMQSDYSTEDATIVSGNADSLASLFAAQQSQLSTLDVSPSPEEESVSTSVSITRRLRTTPRFSGLSQQTYCHMAAS